MSVTYLTTKIVESRRTEQPRYGMTRDGYTKRSGAPTSLMIRLEGETRWRRLMCWQFSNAGTCFIRVKGESLVVPEHDVPTPVAETLVASGRVTITPDGGAGIKAD